MARRLSALLAWPGQRTESAEVVEDEGLPGDCVAEIKELVEQKLQSATTPMQGLVPPADQEAYSKMKLLKIYPRNGGLGLDQIKLPYVNRFYGNADGIH